MGKRKVNKRKPNASFKDALDNMRQAAEAGAVEAFAHARSLAPPRRRGRPSARSEFDKGYAVFDGVLTAVAEEVIAAAMPGNEHELARLVGQHLMSKVVEMTCAGRC